MRSTIDLITSGKSKQIYHQLLDSLTYKEPHLFIKEAYDAYCKSYPSNPSVNGRLFEYMIYETLARGGISPFYYQARFERVPNIEFDIALYDPNSPVALTLKVSLRERYKQADLEEIALRQVYRKARTYLITLAKDEVMGVDRKIADGSIAGIDACLLADTPTYTLLLKELGKRQFSIVEPVLPLSGIVWSE